MLHATLRTSTASSRRLSFSSKGGSPTLHRPRRAVDTRVSNPSAAQQLTSHPPAAVSFKKLLLAIVDSNPYLGDGSRQALAMAAALSRQETDSKVTVLVVDPPHVEAEVTKVKMETVSWHLRDHQATSFEVLEASPEACPAALLGDMVDQVNADVLLLSSEAVHSKVVDANLLAEFVSCPLLLLP